MGFICYAPFGLLAMSTEVDYKAVSHVISSSYRTAIMETLQDGFMTPSEIAEETGHGVAHISRSLSELKERDLVELLVDEGTKKGRLYDLTEKGEQVAETVAERQ